MNRERKVFISCSTHSSDFVVAFTTHFVVFHDVGSYRQRRETNNPYSNATTQITKQDAQRRKAKVLERCDV